MNVQTMTLEQIRRTGLEILAHELGPVGMVRFMQQFEMGQGDYSTERHQWLDTLDVPAIAEQIEQRRGAGP